MRRDKPPKDPRGGHVRLYWQMLDSPAWRALTHVDVRVYLAMRRKLGKTNNGDINATLADMRHAGISSSSTLSTGLQRLEVLGFIEKVRQGGIAFGGKVCSLYRFTDEHTYDIPKAGVKAGPPTDDWKRFGSVAEAKTAVRHFSRKIKERLRESNRSASTSESEKEFSASTIEQVGNSPVRLSNRTPAPKKALKAA
jgi:hypothetical protein